MTKTLGSNESEAQNVDTPTERPMLTLGRKYDMIRDAVQTVRDTLAVAINDPENHRSLSGKLEDFELATMRAVASRKELPRGKRKESQPPAA